MPIDEQGIVRRVQDEWIEIPAELGDGCGISAPIRLRPGNDDDSVRMHFDAASVGREIKIRDLRAGVDAIEAEAA